MQKLATTLHWCLPHLQEKSRNSRTWIMQKLAATLVPSLIFKRRHVFHMYYAKTGNNIFNRAMTESQVSSQAHKVSFTVKPWTRWFVYFLRPLDRQFVLNIHPSSITCFGSFIKIFWPIELNDLLSKTICRPKMIVRSGATFILRWSCLPSIKAEMVNKKWPSSLLFQGWCTQRTHL